MTEKAVDRFEAAFSERAAPVLLAKLSCTAFDPGYRWHADAAADLGRSHFPGPEGHRLDPSPECVSTGGARPNKSTLAIGNRSLFRCSLMVALIISATLRKSLKGE